MCEFSITPLTCKSDLTFKLIKGIYLKACCALNCLQTACFWYEHRYSHADSVSITHDTCIDPPPPHTHTHTHTPTQTPAHIHTHIATQIPPYIHCHAQIQTHTHFALIH